MSYGLRVWDQSGNITLDTTDRTARFYGQYTIPGIANGSSYTLSIPGFSIGSWFAVAYHPYNVYITYASGSINVNRSANAGTKTTNSFVMLVFKT